MKITEVIGTGSVERRVWMRFYKKPRHARYTIERINFKGECSGLELGGRNEAETKSMCLNLLQAWRVGEPEFRLQGASKRSALDELTSAANEAADWLCDAHEGTHQHELGIALRRAVKKVTKGTQ